MGRARQPKEGKLDEKRYSLASRASDPTEFLDVQGAGWPAPRIRSFVLKDVSRYTSVSRNTSIYKGEHLSRPGTDRGSCISAQATLDRARSIRMYRGLLSRRPRVYPLGGERLETRLVVGERGRIAAYGTHSIEAPRSFLSAVREREREKHGDRKIRENAHRLPPTIRKQPPRLHALAFGETPSRWIAPRSRCARELFAVLHRAAGCWRIENWS